MRLSSPVLTRAVGLILADPQQTWRVIAPGVGLLAVVYALNASLVLSPPGRLPIGTTGALAIVLLQLTATIMIVVNWHRYALLDGQEPARQKLAYFRYFLAVFQVSFAIVAVVFAAAIASRFVFMLLGAAGRLLALTDAVLVVAATVLGAWLLFRLCLVLPAAALGDRLSLRASWQATAPLSGELLRIILLLGAIGIVGGAVATGFGVLPDTLSLLFSFPVNCTLMLLSASVISALYGSLVQGRRL